LLRMDDIECRCRVSVLLPDGGKNPNPAISNLQDSLRAIALGVAHFDAMQSFDSDLAHLVGDRTCVDRLAGDGEHTMNRSIGSRASDSYAALWARNQARLLFASSSRRKSNKRGVK